GCLGADVIYSATPTLTMPAFYASDCLSARAAAGAPATDSLLIAWQTSQTEIKARYLAFNPPNDVQPPVFTSQARAPRAMFDGTRFWIVWTDTTDNTIHGATLDLDGTVTNRGPIAFQPSSDDAYELVRQGNVVYFVAASRTELFMQGLCL